MSGEITQIAIFATDVTEQVEARQQAEQLAEEAERQSRRKDEFLAALSHELRNPLAPIANVATLLEREQDAPKPETVSWAAEMVQRQTNHLTHIVDDLLDIARINEGRIDLDLEPIPIGEVVDHAVEEAKSIFEQRDQKLSVDVPRDAVVHGDRVRLVQVLSNLLSNASKYTDEGGDIELEGSTDDDQIRLEVRDDGRGIPPEALDDIFEPFTQLKPASSKSSSGLGFGLSLVRKLVELHGGHVAAHSSGMGTGSQFVIRLPRLSDEEGPRSDSDEHEALEKLPIRVLIIDDDVDVADAMGRLLEPQVEEMAVAHRGARGLEIAEELEPDLVLLDLGMPEMDGIEVAERLQQTEHGERCMLVALTGYGRDADREKTEAAGFDHHLVKPAAPEDLDALLREAASRR